VKGSFLATWKSVDIHQDCQALLRWNEEIADQRIHGTTSAGRSSCSIRRSARPAETAGPGWRR